MDLHRGTRLCRVYGITTKLLTCNPSVLLYTVRDRHEHLYLSTDFSCGAKVSETKVSLDEGEVGIVWEFTFGIPSLDVRIKETDENNGSHLRRGVSAEST